MVVSRHYINGEEHALVGHDGIMVVESIKDLHRAI